MGQNISVFIVYDNGMTSEAQNFHYLPSNNPQNSDLLNKVKNTKKRAKKRKIELGNSINPEKQSKLKRIENELDVFELILKNSRMYELINNMQIEKKLENLRNMLNEIGINQGEYGSNFPTFMTISNNNENNIIPSPRPRKNSILALFEKGLNLLSFDTRKNQQIIESIPQSWIHISERLEDLINLNWMEKVLHFAVKKVQTSPQSFINKIFENKAIKQEYMNKLVSNKSSPIYWNFNFQEIPGPIQLKINNDVVYENTSRDLILTQQKIETLSDTISLIFNVINL